MNNSDVRRVTVLGGMRIPFARAYTAYFNASNQDMMTAALKGVVDKFDLRGATLGDVALGATIKHSADWNLARECALGSGLAPETPAVNVARACGTSLESALVIANKIALGQIDSGIGGGCDSISDTPVFYPRSYQKILLKMNRARSTMEKIKPLLGIRPKHFKPHFPAVVEPRTGLSMGQSAELMAKTWNLTREEQDELALSSHLKAAAAYAEGFYDDQLVPFEGLKADNNVRADSSMEGLAKLKPVFDRSGAGTMTAGNSTPLTDGASAVLLASEQWARERGIPVQAYLTFGKYAAVDFVSKEGLLMAPTYAMSAMLDQAGRSLDSFDFYEIHEAFASQVLSTLRAWESEEFCRDRLARDEPLGSIDPAKLNVKGGSIAVGHPFGATGARTVMTLAKLLADKGSGSGVISVCTGGGMGVTAIMER